MHKTVACTLLSPILSCLAMAWPAPAPMAAPASHASLDPVVVTASPVAQPLSQTPRSTSVITREDIEQSTATNLADLLAEVPGVTIRRRGAPGAQADAGIRGSNFEQTLMLVDGIPLRNPQTGHHNLNVPVPLAQIQRIEIIKGPGAMQYGGSATGGVINIITRTPEESGGGITLLAGSHDTRKLGGWLTLADERTSHMFSASRMQTDGEDPDQPTDADVVRALYTGKARFADARLGWGIAAANKDFGAWGFYSANFPDMRERIQSRLAWARWQQPLGEWTLDSRLYWRGHDDWFRTRIAGHDYINRHQTRVTGYKGKAAVAGGHGTTVIGLNLRHADIDSNALANHQRHKTGLWLLRRQQLGEDFSAEFGINHVDYSDYGSFWLPSLALSWQFADHWHAFASAARTARVPSYTELYLDTAANRGDASLQPERSDFYELGVRGRVGTQHVSASLFQRRTDNLVDWSRLPGEVTWQAGNFDGYRADGLELAWNWRPDSSWLEEFGLAWEGLDVALDSRGHEIVYALRVPRQNWHAHLRLKFGEHARFSFNARRPDYRDQGTATLLGARIGWQGEHLQVSLEGRNLLDEDIIEAGLTPIPGRWFYARIGWDF